MFRTPRRNGQIMMPMGAYANTHEDSDSRRSLTITAMLICRSGSETLPSPSQTVKLVKSPQHAVCDTRNVDYETQREVNYSLT